MPLPLTVEYREQRGKTPAEDRWRRIRLFTSTGDQDELAARAYAVAYHCKNELTVRVRRGDEVVWTSEDYVHAEEIGLMMEPEGT